MDKLARAMERFWLVMGVLSIAWWVYALVADGWAEARNYVWIPPVCFAMAWYRGFTRKRMAAWAERQRQQDRGNAS